jgi:ABC-type amino acid transport substrate-binding protein
MIRFLIFVLALVTAGESFAQTSGVPPELLNNTRRQNGESISVCLDKSGPSRAFDQDVAQAIGDALFLKVNFTEGFGGFPLDGGGFMDELLLAMNNTCDVFMGITVQTNSPFPEAVVVTRPYATMPFVMAVIDPNWKKLGDIPRERMLGTSLQSLGELVYITWSLQQPEDQRWRRLPYADPKLMLKRVEDGRLGGMLIWQPTLAQVLREDPTITNVRIIPTDPLPAAAIRVGALVSSKDSFLRNQIDQTIDALVQDGTIAALMEKHGYLGTAGDE